MLGGARGFLSVIVRSRSVVTVTVGSEQPNEQGKTLMLVPSGVMIHGRRPAG